MGSLVAFFAAHELSQSHPGLVTAVVFTGFASSPGPAAASPLGLRFLHRMTLVRGPRNA
jgi:hypothetical protein